MTNFRVFQKVKKSFASFVLRSPLFIPFPSGSLIKQHLHLAPKKTSKMTSLDNLKNLFRGILCTRMDEEMDKFEMLDLLAYNCTKLRENLRAAQGQKEEDTVLQSYLKEADSLHGPIDDFPEGLDWFNISEPLSLAGNLKGKIVILDFFTYCCINCMHILPDLEKLEKEISVEEGLVVVGVHSAKFENEKDSSNILSAAQRYNITHPVLNDSKFLMWKKLKIHCWPTLLVLGPRGNPLFVLMGEGHANTLSKHVKASLNYYQSEIQSHALPMKLALDMISGKNLKFPAKITRFGSEKLAVSDSGNNRILFLSIKGDVLAIIGGKERGFKDGSFTEARFDSPQGLCFYNDQTIFVADTENHAIRKIDLEAKIVETIVGTGKQGSDFSGGNPTQSISSPWDVVLYQFEDNGVQKEMLIIAMAGTHQIWGYFMDNSNWWRSKKYEKNRCFAIAGNGHEENRNNAYPHNAAFAQPSGLALDPEKKEVFIADSESSTVRKINLVDGKTQGVVGGDRNPQNLFAFGDLDGKQMLAKLQHPLGVCFNPSDRMVYVADTYNHKIKKIDPSISIIETLNITDENGQSFRFNEPGGLCTDASGEYLIVANTNNHTIDRISLADLKRQQLCISFEESKLDDDVVLVSKIIQVTPASKASVVVIIRLKEPVHFTDDAPQKWTVGRKEDGWKFEQEKGAIESGTFTIDFTVPETVVTGQLVQIKCRLSLCAGDKCFPKMFSINCPVSPGVTKNEDTILVSVDEKAVQLL